MPEYTREVPKRLIAVGHAADAGQPLLADVLDRVRQDLVLRVDDMSIDCALYRRKHRGGPPEVTPAALERLRRYSWPGNVRELENVIQRIVVLGTEAVVAEFDEPDGRTTVRESVTNASREPDDGLSDESLGLKELARRAAQAAEREALKRTMAHVHWRRVAAARRLQISYKTLLEKIKHYRLDSPGV